jgi:hypothetical protein
MTFNSLMGFVPFLLMMDEIQEKNKQRLQESIDLYHKSKQYPRKIKKQMKKRALKDYFLFSSLTNYSPFKI